MILISSSFINSLIIFHQTKKNIKTEKYSIFWLFFPLINFLFCLANMIPLAEKERKIHSKKIKYFSYYISTFCTLPDFIFLCLNQFPEKCLHEKIVFGSVNSFIKILRYFLFMRLFYDLGHIKLEEIVTMLLMVIFWLEILLIGFLSLFGFFYDQFHLGERKALKYLTLIFCLIIVCCVAYPLLVFLFLNFLDSFDYRYYNFDHNGSWIVLNLVLIGIVITGAFFIFRNRRRNKLRIHKFKYGKI